MSQALQIRAVEAGDEADWRRLWAEYLAFYQTTASDEVYQTTFARLLYDRIARNLGFIRYTR